MATILQLYAKRLQNIDASYTANKISRKTLEKELKAIVKELTRLAKGR